jgi:hypothetical protein
MQTMLIRCLIINLAVLILSGALLLWGPKDNGFTITSGGATHFLPGGLFLGYGLVFLFDLVIALYLGWRLWHPVA